MLKTFVNTSENYDAFLRPAILESIGQVLKFYSLESAANIYYNGGTDIATMVGATADDGLNADRYTDGIFRNKIFIAAEIERSPFWSNRRENTEQPVLDDGGVLPLRLSPSFENKKISVKVVAMFNSQIDAENLRARINRLNENMAVNFTYAPTVHMVVNRSLIEFFSSLYDMKKKWEPNLEPPGNWLNAQWTRPYRVVTNEAGNNQQIVVPIRFQDIEIRLDDPFIARTNKGNVYGRFEVEFNYNFYLNDFIGWELEYPLTVWQDEIPAKFVPAPQKQYTNRANWVAAPEIAAMQSFSSYMTSPQSPYYLKLPEHDPWTFPHQNWVMPVIQARFALEDKETQPLCNIFTELDQFVWSDRVKAYMLRRREVVFQHNQTPFLVQVFKGKNPLPPEALEMDALGNITLKVRPDLREIYRIMICMDYAVRDYSEAFWDDISKNPDVWRIVFSLFPWFDWSLVPRPLIQNINYIRKHIDLGWGKWDSRFNIYECAIGLIAHNEQDFTPWR